MEQQEFLFADGDASRLGIPAAEDPLVRDIAAVWKLPIGQRVRLDLRETENLSTVTGRLELAAAPDIPFDPRQALQLRVRGYLFSSRAVVSWSLFDG
jgi:hypothetical protein